jgi:phytoene synthase
MLPPEFASGLARARQFTNGRQNPLVQAAERFLDPQRRAFFDLAYASMRIADDLVDEEFLTLPLSHRREQRPAAVRALDDWLSQAMACAGEIEISRAPHYEVELFAALGHFLRRSTLGARPWRLLARSLRRDLHERPIETWPEYLEYCEGACVAPATVFVYLLGAEFDSDDASRFTPDAPERVARPLAIFAYLVHLLRDLAKDARRNPQLVHLPRLWFQTTDRDFLSVVSDLALNGSLPETVSIALSGHLEAAHQRARVEVNRAAELLQPSAHAALRFVVESYADACREIVLARARSGSA